MGFQSAGMRRLRQDIGYVKPAQRDCCGQCTHSNVGWSNGPQTRLVCARTKPALDVAKGAICRHFDPRPKP